MTHECTCNEKFRTAEDYRDHLPCNARDELAELKERNFKLVVHAARLVIENDRYKKALERIVKSTSGTFRDIARDVLNS